MKKRIFHISEAVLLKSDLYVITFLLAVNAYQKEPQTLFLILKI